MKNALLIFAFLSFYLSSVHASVEIRSNKLTTGDGLANNSIRYMFQDSKGFMWMGTVNGLSYYDGNSFVSIYPDPNLPISLADPRIRNMEEDSNGFLWIATLSSLYSCYDLKHGRFVDFTGCGEYKQSYSKKSLHPTSLSGCGITITAVVVSSIRMASSRRRHTKRIRQPIFWRGIVCLRKQWQSRTCMDRNQARIMEIPWRHTGSNGYTGESWEHIFSYDQYTCIITGKKKSTATLFPITDWRKSLH